jgi:biotin synthase-like enzyme
MYLHNAAGEYVCEFCGGSSDEDCPEECGWLRQPDDLVGEMIAADLAGQETED